MPVINRIADYANDMKEWRQWMHRHPELEFDCHETSAFVVERLKEFGITEIHTGIATTGVVAIIEGQGDGPTIGLRTDMDALPMQETTGLDYASETPGKMHACGHDGHTTMLLGAARYLAETRRFKGRVALIFQPAEEEGAGAEVMVNEGIMDKFDIEHVYAMHNSPGVPEGELHTNGGALMSAVDTFEVHLTGQGGHGGMPHSTVDPLPAAVGIYQGFQTIVSRNNHFRKDLVISVTQVHSGTCNNIVPETAYLNGTIRAFDNEVREMTRARMEEIVKGQAASFGVEATFSYEYGYPALINDPDKSKFAVDVARDVVGDARVNANAERETVAEDFSYMLAERPGCYLYLGQGGGPAWHHPKFDFNDDIAPVGASFFARLVEMANPL